MSTECTFPLPDLLPGDRFSFVTPLEGTYPGYTVESVGTDHLMARLTGRASARPRRFEFGAQPEPKTCFLRERGAEGQRRDRAQAAADASNALATVVESERPDEYTRGYEAGFHDGVAGEQLTIAFLRAALDDAQADIDSLHDECASLYEDLIDTEADLVDALAGEPYFADEATPTIILVLS